MTDTHAEKLGFEPFGTVDGVLRGDPIKIMPVGRFYRDSRVIDISEDDLREIERNTSAGLPRFRIPINENHGTDGKVGTVNKVKYMADGPEGKGLYAVDYSLTEAGQAAIKARKWDAVSPELIWSKNGASYIDPQSGRKYDNILSGLALCDKPFFSHEHVALFTADAPSEDKPKRGNGYTAVKGKIKSFIAELEQYLKDEDGDGVPDAEQTEGMAVQVPAPVVTVHHMNSAVIPVAGIADTPAAEAASQGVETMAEDKPTPPAPEQMTQAITAEQFAAVQAELAVQKQAAEKFAAELKQVGRARRLDQLTARVEGFTAIGAEKAELAAKLMDLEEQAPAVFAYFDGLLAQLDGALATGGLFNAQASGRQPKEDRGADTFTDKVNAVWAEKYDGAPDKYEAAATEVAKAHPALYQASRGR